MNQKRTHKESSKSPEEQQEISRKIRELVDHQRKAMQGKQRLKYLLYGLMGTGSAWGIMVLLTGFWAMPAGSFLRFATVSGGLFLSACLYAIPAVTRSDAARQLDEILGTRDVFLTIAGLQEETSNRFFPLLCEHARAALSQYNDSLSSVSSMEIRNGLICSILFGVAFAGHILVPTADAEDTTGPSVQRSVSPYVQSANDGPKNTVTSSRKHRDVESSTSHQQSSPSPEALLEEMEGLQTPAPGTEGKAKDLSGNRDLEAIRDQVTDILEKDRRARSIRDDAKSLSDESTPGTGEGAGDATRESVRENQIKRRLKQLRDGESNSSSPPSSNGDTSSDQRSLESYILTREEREKFQNMRSQLNRLVNESEANHSSSNSENHSGRGLSTGTGEGSRETDFPPRDMSLPDHIEERNTTTTAKRSHDWSPAYDRAIQTFDKAVFRHFFESRSTKSE